MIQSAENKPYQPDLVVFHHIPEDVDYPTSDEEVVNLTRQIHQAESEQLLPSEFRQLETEFAKVYETQYQEGRSIDIRPPELDFAYQQYGLTKDRKEGRNGFNSFGSYALSYLDGLRVMGLRQGYLGTGGWEHIIKPQYRSLLLGCSSITTAEQFANFVHAINPQAEAIVTDIDPLATQLAQAALENEQNCAVVASDAQKLPLADESIDFIATNFLVPNLIDAHDSGRETLEQVLAEASRVLSPEGVLVMVEQLERNDLEWLTHWASKHNLKLEHPDNEGGWGINRHAVRLPSQESVDQVIETIPEFIQESTESEEYKSSPTPYFQTDPRKYYKGQPVQAATNLIFVKSSN